MTTKTATSPAAAIDSIQEAAATVILTACERAGLREGRFVDAHHVEGRGLDGEDVRLLIRHRSLKSDPSGMHVGQSDWDSHENNAHDFGWKAGLVLAFPRYSRSRVSVEVVVALPQLVEAALATSSEADALRPGGGQDTAIYLSTSDPGMRTHICQSRGGFVMNAPLPAAPPVLV
ncbi:hypothetical protein DWB68_15075 [Galactobacter valiniphilus]|uniref:Uncharacterized protein n=1 Tax=Galactobacter valiniphilus TaxID=2676122 RepID=A0A399J9V6_9MICC|nr:hypothetical protein [Galactobacter valiniphilus]RII40969.1 hypothetical protein DWB68_15075 [Galactobacter valiniphilus]